MNRLAAAAMPQTAHSTTSCRGGSATCSPVLVMAPTVANLIDIARRGVGGCRVRRTLVAVEDQQILARVHELVAEEHRLREGGPGLSAEARERLQQLERDLDQCWDVLRQRRARREFGENPDDAAVRPSGEVEGYLQ
jgi:hypothetical protein